jgi:hypothetical protein
MIWGDGIIGRKQEEKQQIIACSLNLLTNYCLSLEYSLDSGYFQTT